MSILNSIIEGTSLHPEREQEIPALFIEPSYSTLATYSGDSHGLAMRLNSPSQVVQTESRRMTESWVAYLNADQHGLGIHVPAANRLTCYRYGDGASRDSCSYVAPLTRFAIEPGMVWKYRASVTLGSREEIRAPIRRASRTESNG
ncbi:MAG: hypothetical protein R3B96_13115 [Pirellulaceae bacterium]